MYVLKAHRVQYCHKWSEGGWNGSEGGSNISKWSGMLAKCKHTQQEYEITSFVLTYGISALPGRVFATLQAGLIHGGVTRTRQI